MTDKKIDELHSDTVLPSKEDYQFLSDINDQLLIIKSAVDILVTDMGQTNEHNRNNKSE